MKKKVYVIMKQRQSPICRFVAIPHLVVLSKFVAHKIVDELNGKAQKNLYWSHCVDMEDVC